MSGQWALWKPYECAADARAVTSPRFSADVRAEERDPCVKWKYRCSLRCNPSGPRKWEIGPRGCWWSAVPVGDCCDHRCTGAPVEPEQFCLHLRKPGVPSMPGVSVNEAAGISVRDLPEGRVPLQKKKARPIGNASGLKEKLKRDYSIRRSSPADMSSGCI